MIWQGRNMSECFMWNYMCICWLINWSDSTKMHGATIRFIDIMNFKISQICWIPFYLVQQFNNVERRKFRFSLKIFILPPLWHCRPITCHHLSCVAFRYHFDCILQSDMQLNNNHRHHRHHLSLQPFVGFRLLSQVCPSSSVHSCFLSVFNFQLF